MAAPGGHPLIVARYIPRFHQIPESDAWHGDGYSEWTLVAGRSARLAGPGAHDLPGELGFYDQRVPQTRHAQAQLAREHGISGFLYSHFWFSGRQLFQRPFDEVRASGAPEFPFALCWENGDWRRSPPGSELLLAQEYSEVDDAAHAVHLIASFKDPRYIRIGGRPLLVIGSAHLLPDPARTVEVWRAECARAGTEPPWLVMMEDGGGAADPAAWGFDASAEGPPGGSEKGEGAFSYAGLVADRVDRAAPAWVRYPTVVPDWDSTPWHPQGGGLVARDATPERYGQWLATALHRQEATSGGEGLVFIHAWNDWANGAHLEPGTRWGRAYLQATRDVVERSTGTVIEEAGATSAVAEGPAQADELYADLYRRYRDLQASASGFLSHADRRLQATEARQADALATSREESRRLAASTAALEDLLAMQTKRADELQALLEYRPAIAAPVSNNTGSQPFAGNGQPRYLELLKACLTRMLFLNDAPGRDPHEMARLREVRMIGKDWPEDAETMIGMVRLDCIQHCAETVLRDNVPGDFLEAGVWRGGATIFMKGVLAAYGVGDRRVWVADSFRGLPVPDAANFPQDVPEDLSSFDELAVSQEQVRSNFARYGLLDDQVRFLEGWFKDTLPTAPVDALAVLRLDGDYYESTIQILESLYHKVSPGGFVIVDDYGCIEACRQAVTDFRAANGIEDEIVPVDWTGVYWRRALA